MRKLLFTLSLVFGIAGTNFALAETTSLLDLLNGLPAQLEKLPDVKQGAAWSLEDSQINYLTTVNVPVKKLNDMNVGVGVGAAYDAEHSGVKAVVNLSYLLQPAIAGVGKVNIEPGIWAGIGRVEGFQDSQLKCEGDYGLSINVVKVF